MSDLVSEQQYRMRSRDLSTEPFRVLSALADAQDVLEDRLGRRLAYGEHTEQLDVFPDRMVFPTVTPLDAQDGYVDQVTLLALGEVSWFGSAYSWEPGQSGTALVTYTGGWRSDNLPACLRDAIIDLAQDRLREAGAGPGGLDLTGAKSVSVGDVSVSWGVGGDRWPSGVWQSVRKYARRVVVPS